MHANLIPELEQNAWNPFQGKLVVFSVEPRLDWNLQGPPHNPWSEHVVVSSAPKYLTKKSVCEDSSFLLVWWGVRQDHSTMWAARQGPFVIHLTPDHQRYLWSIISWAESERGSRCTRWKRPPSLMPLICLDLVAIERTHVCMWMSEGVMWENETHTHTHTVCSINLAANCQAVKRGESVITFALLDSTAIFQSRRSREAMQMHSEVLLGWEWGPNKLWPLFVRQQTVFLNGPKIGPDYNSIFLCSRGHQLKWFMPIDFGDSLSWLCPSLELLLWNTCTGSLVRAENMHPSCCCTKNLQLSIWQRAITRLNAFDLWSRRLRISSSRPGSCEREHVRKDFSFWWAFWKVSYLNEICRESSNLRLPFVLQNFYNF